MNIIYQNIKSITLVLENCFRVLIPAQYVGVVKTGIFYNDGARNCVNGLVLSIKRGFHFSIFDDIAVNLQYLHDHHDIVLLDIIYENDEKQEIWIDCWDEEFYENQYQHSKFNRYGDLFTVINVNSLLLNQEFPDDIINIDEYKIN